MASEIRANKQTNRAGLGTVTYADTGIIVSGIVTCTELSGLTALNIAGVGTASTLDINGDIDVDGHTNLDNTSIVGIVTISAGTNNEGLRITGQHNNCVIFTSPSINGSAGYRLNHHPSTNFLRVDTTDQNGAFTGTVAKFSSAGLDMSDNIKLRLGTNQDLTLYHYGNDAYIDNADGDIIFRQGTTEKLRIESNGNVRVSDQHLRFDTTGKGIIFGIDGGSNRPSIIGNYTSSTNNNMVFNVTGEERVRIDSSGILWMNYGNAASDSLIILDKQGSGEAALRFYNASANKAKIALDSDEHLTFDVNNGERLRIDSNGKTTSYGQIALSAGGAERFNISHTSGGNVLVKNPTGANITFQIQNNSDQLQLHNNGRVGIGIGSPDGKLHISSGTNGDCVLIIEADTDNNQEADNPRIEFRQDGGLPVSSIGHGLLSGDENGLVFANCVTNGYMAFATGDGANDHTQATERIRITSDGKIGINDSAPERTMDVRGSNCMIQLEGTAGNGRQYSLCSTDNATGTGVDGGPAGTFVIYDDTASQARLRIDQNGNTTFFVTGGTLTSSATGSYGISIHNHNSPSMGHLFIYGDNGLIRFRNTSNTYTAQMGYSESSNTLFFANQEGGTTMYINADGAQLYDNNKFLCGNDKDLEIYHNNSNAFIKNDTGYTMYRAGQHVFENSNGSTEMLRILSTGGITFNGDTANANALDDYEEGTFTPSIIRSSAGYNQNYNYRHGVYTRIGRLVHCYIDVDIHSFSGGGGHVGLSGLPFSVNSHGLPGWPHSMHMARCYTDGDYAAGVDAKSIRFTGSNYGYLMNIDDDQWDYGNYSRVIFTGQFTYMV